MRGIISIGLAIVGIAAVLLVAPAVEEVTDVVAEDDSIQDRGWDTYVTDTRAAVLKWTPLMGIVVASIAALAWYLRRQRTTARTRRR